MLLKDRRITLESLLAETRLLQSAASARMMAKVLLALLCAIAVTRTHASFYPDDGDVIEMDASSLQELQSPNATAHLVEFFAPW